MSDKIEVRYEIAHEQDDIPVRGNALNSGDAAIDQEAEDQILARLDQGDDWAWASVEVRAIVEFEGQTFMGNDYLGCCCYENEEDFKRCGYFDDMKAAALERLREFIASEIKRGEIAARVLKGLK